MTVGIREESGRNTPAGAAAHSVDGVFVSATLLDFRRESTRDLAAHNVDGSFSNDVAICYALFYGLR